MSWTGTLTELAKQSINALGGPFTQHKVGSRLSGIGLTAAFAPYVSVGTSASPTTLTTYANHGAEIYTTCASTDTSNSVEAVYVKSVMTGIGGVGGRSRFHMYTNVALGDWSNALKAYAEYGASGRTTGLGSALCAETILSAGTSSGTYTALEANIIADAAVSTGTLTSFFRCNIAGTNSTGKTTLNTNAYLFDLGEGIVDTANGLYDVATITATDFSGRLRVRIAGADMWIGVNTDPDFTR